MANNRQLFLQHLAQTSPTPMSLEIVRGEGMYLYDPSGKAYMDMIAGIGVSVLGHCHPAVSQAIKDQVDLYMHTLVYGEFILSPQVKLAEWLHQHLPDSLQQTYFVNSGSEATEGAMKLAKRYTGRQEIISARYAYHGSTQGAASLMNPTTFTSAFQPLLPRINHIDYNNFADLTKITTQTAAVIVETVQGEAGVKKPVEGYLQALRKRCDETGTLLVLDEIQAGCGRTGSLWAFEQYGIVPDILLLAKALGGGMPIGAFISSREIMQCLTHDPVLGHITTFGGHPVNCAAALANLQTIEALDLIRDVPAKAALFKELLVHPGILDFRQAGLLMAVELAGFEQVLAVVDYCLKQGLITDWFLFNEQSLRLAPPLIITHDQIKDACKVILDGIQKTTA
ncbi:MAG: aspartate aminotransferase family protein [Saprospiraceae bacterium]|nr:aspartate aminotransferase family protein [Saprospiraceae bacterium]